MARKQTPKPTASELAILRVLWRCGPSTVREVKDALNSDKPIGYTTVLKLMQIMHEKSLLHRDESQRSHVYRTAVPAEKTRGQLVTDLIDRAFEGSARKLVMQALSSQKASPDELKQIRSMLDEIEGRLS
jgi:predicted transcriptional regulator